MARPRKKPAEPWDAGRLGRVLELQFNAPGKRGHVDAAKVAAELGVSTRTVQRWVRGPLPASRRAQFERLVLPGDPAIEQEERELAYAREALRDVYGLGSPMNPDWAKEGWLEPHLLAVVEFDRLGVCVPRLAIANGGTKMRERLRAGGGVIVDQDLFPNRFAAQIAKAELLESVRRWRVVMPHGLLARGRTEAWLRDAPRRRVSWFVDNAELRPPARKKRTTATATPRRRAAPAKRS